MGDGYMSITVLYVNSYPPFFGSFFPLDLVFKDCLEWSDFNPVGPLPLVPSAIYMTFASPGFPSPPSAPFTHASHSSILSL